MALIKLIPMVNLTVNTPRSICWYKAIRVIPPTDGHDRSAQEVEPCKFAPITLEYFYEILDISKVFNDATYTLLGVYYSITYLFFIISINNIGAFEEI